MGDYQPAKVPGYCLGDIAGAWRGQRVGYISQPGRGGIQVDKLRGRQLGEHILRLDAPMPAWQRLLTDQIKQPPGRIRAAARGELVRSHTYGTGQRGTI